MPLSDAVSDVPGAGGATALLIIDMQNAFFEDAMLARVQHALVGACNRLIDAAHHGNSPVLLVRTEHLRDRSTWTLSMLDDDQGFIFHGSRQADPVDGLRVDGLETLTKTRDSAFFGTDLAERLREQGVERLVLAGVSTHNCVAHTGADAFAGDFRVSYALDAIGSTNHQYAEAMLEILSVEYRQAIIGQAEAEALLR
jgi:nicotinamidase-related amidase